jgi:hypothetical protein
LLHGEFRGLASSRRINRFGSVLNRISAGLGLGASFSRVLENDDFRFRENFAAQLRG